MEEPMTNPMTDLMIKPYDWPQDQSYDQRNDKKNYQLIKNVNACQGSVAIFQCFIMYDAAKNPCKWYV